MAVATCGKACSHPGDLGAEIQGGSQKVTSFKVHPQGFVSASKTRGTKVSSPQAASLPDFQIFRHASLWGTFFLQTTTVSSACFYLKSKEQPRIEEVEKW